MSSEGEKATLRGARRGRHGVDRGHIVGDNIELNEWPNGALEIMQGADNVMIDSEADVRLLHESLTEWIEVFAGKQELKEAKA
jgi:hypothetical protein